MNTSAHPFASSRPAPKGFALIVTLGLMTLLLLLVLTLTTLVRTHLQTAQANLLDTQARENALFAAYVAVGQLQKFAGPDQRTTTTADLGHYEDQVDRTAANVNGQLFGFGSTLTPTPIPHPFGQNAGYQVGGTRFWTAIWGNGVNPLAIYTGQGVAYDGSTQKGPMPILMNWLVSGNENTPLVANYKTNGVVTPPLGIRYTSDTGDPAAGVASNTIKDQFNWTALTNDIHIAPKYGDVLAPQPGVVLVGPNSALTSIQIPINLKTSSGAVINHYSHEINLIVAPLVNIHSATTDENANPFTSGRFAYWVGDEGVKAKYNPVDPYVGSTTASAATANGQVSRYRFFAPLRTGIERMLGFSPSPVGTPADPTALVNSPVTSNPAVTKLLSRITQPTQVLLIDKNLASPGLDGQGQDSNHPEQSIQLHFHDFTTISYGVLSDSLRSGLRYDLTSAFETTQAGQPYAVFTDATNGLNNKSFLPAFANSTATTTTEPNIVGNGGTTAQLKIQVDGSNFHGPSSAPKWNILQSYYQLADASKKQTQVAGNNGVINAVKMQAGNATQAGVTPVILQARLNFGQYCDDSREQYVSVEPIFVLANPYNFPITAPDGGLDLGYRINTDTKWEWGFSLVARNSDQRSTNGGQARGAGMAISYDTTQNDLGPNIGLDPLRTKLVTNYGAPYVSTSLNANPTPGYTAVLKNPVSYISFRNSGVAAPSNNLYNSILDQVAFHIKHGIDSTFMPGEAKMFILGGTDLSANLRTPRGPIPFVDINAAVLGGAKGEIHAIVGTANMTGAANTFTFNGSMVAPVLLTPSFGGSSHRYMMRDTGVNTATGKAKLDTVRFPNFQPVANETDNNPWPDPRYGYISSAYPSIACTLELRYDTTELFPGNAPSASSAPSSSLRGAASSIGDVNPVPTTVVGAVGAGIAAPGQNVLQAITNMDLSGAGLSGRTQNTSIPIADAYMPPLPPNQRYRRQYIDTANNGAMPAFLTSYVMAMILPGNMTPGTQFWWNANVGIGTVFPSGTFDPAAIQQNNVPVGYSIYKDFNLRATNMALPPFVPFNAAFTDDTSNNIVVNSFQTVPPYARVWDQGQPDDTQILAASSQTFYSNALGGMNSETTTTSAGSRWGYAFNSQKGEQYVTLYGLPQRFNSTGTVGATAGTFPDVPILSLGQLQHADVTADDIWVSVGYQPGNAIGNSYFTPFVTRGSTVQPHLNQSAKKVMAYWTAGTNNQVLLPNSPTANAYDISYLMNVALWDRYFFSTLTPGEAPTPAGVMTPANSRLVYAAGYNPTKDQLGVGSNAINVPDPSTGLQMFRAYAPARYMMVDGAFNVNSTSFEAWRAILSSMRGVAYSNSLNNNTKPVAYFPRVSTTEKLNAFVGGAGRLNIGLDPTDPADANANTAGANAVSYAGFRQLTDAEIDSLAAKIVLMVRERGPFLSLAQFVNRTLATYTGQNAPPIATVSGPIQAAIDLSLGGGIFPSLNTMNGLTGPLATANWSPNAAPSTTAIFPDGPLGVASIASGGGSNPYARFAGSADPTSRVAGIPGWLTQADILQALGPILSVRSDTFLVRTYGEVLSPEISQKNIADTVSSDPNAVLSRAWCELVVQRVPEYLATDKASINDPTTTTGYGAPNPSANINAPLSPVNAAFGRRFRIVSIRWLTPNDI